VNPIKPTRFKIFSGILLFAVFCYLVDCLGTYDRHPELPWFQRGIYAGGPTGFYATVCFAIGAFVYLIVGKDR